METSGICSIRKYKTPDKVLASTIPGFIDNIALLRNANPNAVGDCDGCVECCIQPPIENMPGFNKPANVPCRYLSPILGSGCSIYEQRPECCILFECWARYLIRHNRIDIYLKLCQELEKDGQRTVTTKVK